MKKEQTSSHLTLPVESRSQEKPLPSNATDRWLARKFLTALANPPFALTLWDGQEVASHPAPRVRIQFNDRGALYRLLINPELHFGDLYSVGRIEVAGDLVAGIEAAYHAFTDASRPGTLRKIRTQLLNRARPNHLSASRHNIHHHYDLGNDFYQLWLDREAMQYTCAYFPAPGLTIEEAQRAKMDHVARKLQLKPGDTVAEAGCGWGGLARHFARHYGVKVRSYNISKEQIAYARAKAQEQNLSDRVEYVEDDYRNMAGSYDVFVSVGMLEHVGREHYATLGKVARSILKPEGRALIHSIGRNRPERLNAWIEKRIFPGSYPPSLKETMDIFEPNGFSVLDVENLRLHYAKTLEHWLSRFEDNANTVARMFDEDFVRAWRLYLAGSIAAFTCGTMQLFQIVFTHAHNNHLPWSREHLYRGAGAVKTTRVHEPELTD